MLVVVGERGRRVHAEEARHRQPHIGHAVDGERTQRPEQLRAEALAQRHVHADHGEPVK